MLTLTMSTKNKKHQEDSFVCGGAREDVVLSGGVLCWPQTTKILKFDTDHQQFMSIECVFLAALPLCSVVAPRLLV
jgi:hypothetical protein